MKDLGLILLGGCGMGTEPYKPRQPRRFTWDLVADLGVPRTLEVLRGKPVVYLSSITQSNLEITKLVSPADHRPCSNDISIDEKFFNCNIDDVNDILSLIRNYANDIDSEFDVPIDGIEAMLTRQLNMSTIVVAPKISIDGTKRIHVFSNEELRDVLPRDKYDKITDPNFEDTAIVHNHIPYMVAMSTKYKESENMWFLRNFAHQLPSDTLEKMIGTMLAITNESMISGESCNEGSVVAVVLDYSKPFGCRLVDVHARDKNYPSKVISDIMDSKIKPGNFTIEGKGHYRLLFASTNERLRSPDPTDRMIYDVNILDLLNPALVSDLSTEEKQKILKLLEKNTVDPITD